MLLTSCIPDPDARPKVAGDPTTELERILRYWGGNMRHYDLSQPVTTDISDSEYTVVGSWSLG